jgi:hypothetical protein
MNIKFTYVNAKGEKKPRNVIVVHESAGKISGFDLKSLNRSEAAKVRKVFGAKPVTPFPEEKTTVDYAALGIPKEVFVRSYRTFNKADIR